MTFGSRSSRFGGWRTLAGSLAVCLVAAATTVLTVGSVNASVFPNHEGFEQVWAGNDGQMRALVPIDQSANSGAFLAPNTSPVVAGLGNGQVELAFVGPDHNLWRAFPEDNFFTAGFEVGRSLGVAPGTSPAVASDGNGHWKIAFQGSNGHMWTIDSSRTIIDSGAPMAPGSSPSLAWLPDAGGYEIAFVGSDHNLWRAFPDTNAFPTGPNFSAVGVAPNTSPAIATDGHNGWKIAFQGTNGHLQTMSGNSLVDSGAAMAPGSNPSLTWLSGTANGYEIAFVGSDHNLWRAFPDTNTFLAGPHFTAVGVAANTSPSIVKFGPPGFSTSSFQIAFQGTNGHMWVIDDRPSIVDTNAPMAPGTTPSVTWRTFTPTSPPTTSPPTSQPPSPQMTTVTLERQQVTQGPIPYLGRFPAFGTIQPGRVLSIQNPQRPGFDTITLFFVRPGHSTTECGNASAVVQLNQGQTTTPAQMTSAFGVAQPPFSTLSPLNFLACASTTSGQLLNTIQINITYQLN